MLPCPWGRGGLHGWTPVKGGGQDGMCGNIYWKLFVEPCGGRNRFGDGKLAWKGLGGALLGLKLPLGKGLSGIIGVENWGGA